MVLDRCLLRECFQGAENDEIFSRYTFEEQIRFLLDAEGLTGFSGSLINRTVTFDRVVESNRCTAEILHLIIDKGKDYSLTSVENAVKKKVHPDKIKILLTFLDAEDWEYDNQILDTKYSAFKNLLACALSHQCPPDVIKIILRKTIRTTSLHFDLFFKASYDEEIFNLLIGKASDVPIYYANEAYKKGYSNDTKLMLSLKIDREEYIKEWVCTLDPSGRYSDLCVAIEIYNKELYLRCP